MEIVFHFRRIPVEKSSGFPLEVPIMQHYVCGFDLVSTAAPVLSSGSWGNCILSTCKNETNFSHHLIIFDCQLLWSCVNCSASVIKWFWGSFVLDLGIKHQLKCCLYDLDILGLNEFDRFTQNYFSKITHSKIHALLSLTKGHLFLFNHFIDMRTTVSLSISCRKNVFLLKFSNKNTFFHMK